MLLAGWEHPTRRTRGESRLEVLSFWLYFKLIWTIPRRRYCNHFPHMFYWGNSLRFLSVYRFQSVFNEFFLRDGINCIETQPLIADQETLQYKMTSMHWDLWRDRDAFAKMHCRGHFVLESFLIRNARLSLDAIESRCNWISMKWRLDAVETGCIWASLISIEAQIHRGSIASEAHSSRLKCIESQLHRDSTAHWGSSDSPIQNGFCNAS